MTTIIERNDLPDGCIGDCSHSGACDDDVAHWLKNPTVSALLDSISTDDIRHCLRGYGGWDADELADDERNRARLLWIICGDFKEGDSETIFAVE